MKKILYAIALLLGSQASAQYVSQGPRGGAASGFYQDGGRMWVASSSGPYFSDDQGLTWHAPTAVPSVFGCDNIVSVAAFGNEIMAGSQRSGIFFSPDAGSTWSTVNNLLLKGVPYSDMEVAGNNFLSIRADSGVLYRTQDRGTSWIRMNIAINNAAAKWLSFNNNALYVTTDQGIFKSMDNGLSYMNINSNAADIGELVWVNDTAYVASAAGVRRSVDDAASFTTVGLAGQPVHALTVFGSSIFASVRHASGNDTLKYSTDGGLSFVNAAFPTAIPFQQVHDLTVLNGRVLAGTDYGMYQSPATGSIAFTRGDSGFNATRIHAMAVNGLRLYAATSPMGVFYTADSAETWRHNGDLTHSVEKEVLSVDAKNQFVHAGGAANYYRSSDFGLTWNVGATGLPPGRITSVFAFKSAPDVLVIRNGDLYLSTNDGSSFSPVSSGIPAGSAYYVTQTDTGLFVAATGGVYKGSSSYAFTLMTGITHPVTSIVYKAPNFYAGTAGGGLFMSNGLAWKLATITAPGTLPGKINALAMNGAAMIAATDDGLYSDSTGIWLHDSLRGKAIYSLAVMNGKVYAGTCGGVWSLKNLPAPPPIVGVAGAGSNGTAIGVYPNPASGDFKVVLRSELGAEAVLSLRDMLGNTLLQLPVQLQAGRNELSVPAAGLHLASGIYLVQVASGDGIAAARIMIR